MTIFVIHVQNFWGATANFGPWLLPWPYYQRLEGRSQKRFVTLQWYQASETKFVLCCAFVYRKIDRMIVQVSSKGISVPVAALLLYATVCGTGVLTLPNALVKTGWAGWYLNTVLLVLCLASCKCCTFCTVCETR